MTDMGLLRYLLGIEVEKNENNFFISQAKYVKEVLEIFNMPDCKAAINPTVMGLKLNKEDNSKDFDLSLYKSIVGSLMYACCEFNFQIYGKAKGGTLASNKKNSKVCERNKEVWNFIHHFRKF